MKGAISASGRSLPPPIKGRDIEVAARLVDGQSLKFFWQRIETRRNRARQQHRDRLAAYEASFGAGGGNGPNRDGVSGA